MNILYDHQAFSMQKFGGISRYYYELMNHSSGLFSYSLSGKYSENEYIMNTEYYKPLTSHKFKGKNTLQSNINKYYSLKAIHKNDYDIFHPTYYDTYFVNNVKKPVVVTIYDMIHELFPHFFPKDKKTVINKKKLLYSCDKIIAISQSTKNDIIKIYPDINAEKIQVVYLGNSFSVKNENKKEENYLLFTGQRLIYKNFEKFVIAIAPLLIKYNIILKCTGNPFSNYEKGLFQSLGISSYVSVIYATDSQLALLYSNALAFVFPSLYEGFGIPVLESFASNCPAIISNKSSLPEIGEDAVVYFDPYSIDDMRKSIENVINSKDLRNSLIKKGRKQLEKFSLQKCADETFLIYTTLIGK